MKKTHAGIRRAHAGLRPLRSPPAYVEVEESDCLHGEGVAFAQALNAAGADARLEDVPGTFHGFDCFTGKEISRAMVQKRLQALRQAFRLCPG